MKKKILVSAVLVLISVTSFAFNPWAYHGPKRDIVTLIVTPNFQKPRLIAELIQDESRQPFMLYSARNQDKLYFCPPKHLGNPKVIARTRISRIVAFIAPKQIIVLGDSKYVPDDIVNELRKIAPVMVVSAENWQQVAESVAPMLNLSKLPKSYRKLSAQLDSGRLYVPEKNNTEASVIANDKKAPVAASDKKAPAEPEIVAPAADKKSEVKEEYPAFDAPASDNKKDAKDDKVPADVAPLA